MKLMQISNHPDLIKVDRRRPDRVQRRDEAFARLAFGSDLEAIGGVQRQQRFQDMYSIQHCGKMQVLSKLLQKHKRKRDKVLLFSSTTRMLDIIEMFAKGKVRAGQMLLKTPLSRSALQRRVVEL